MGNQSYPASSIIGGVSTQDYALRLDSQATDQRNCWLAPQYGLCKRPGSQFLRETITYDNGDGSGSHGNGGAKLFTIYHDGKEFIALLKRFGDLHIYDNQGVEQPIIRLPRSTESDQNSWYDYFQASLPGQAGGANEDNISHTTIGNITYLNNSDKQPVMDRLSGWQGYKEQYWTQGGSAGSTANFIGSHLTVQTCFNDQAFAFWVRGAAVGEGDNYSCGITYKYTHSTASGTPPGVYAGFNRKDVRARCSTTKEAGSLGDGTLDATTATTRAYAGVASILAYQLQVGSCTYNVGEYTNLIENNLSPNTDPEFNSFFIGSVIPNTDPGQPYPNENCTTNEETGVETCGRIGNNVFPDMNQGFGAIYGAVDTHTHYVMESATTVITGRVRYPWPVVNVFSGENNNISVCWKNVDSVADLPPRSWLNHTVAVTSDAKSLDKFYMRFTSDEDPVLYWYEARNSSGGVNTDLRHMYPTLNLPRTGYWEEYCGYKVLQDIDTTTMPHILAYRPPVKDGGLDGVDTVGAFVMLEGAKDLQINKEQDTVTFNAADDTLTFLVDPGFTRYPGDEANLAKVPFLVAGDTLRFRAYNPDGPEAAGFPDPPSEQTAINGSPFQKTNIYEDRVYTIKSIELETWSGQIQVILSLPDDYTVNITLPYGENEGTQVYTRDIQVILDTYDHLGWASRYAGDDTTNPLPAFFSSPIKNVSNYQNRLVFSTDSQVCFSGTADYGNFFRTTVRDLIDSDPFSLAPATDDGSLIKHTVPFKDNLIVLTTNSQHVVHGADGALSPKTAQILPATKATSDFFVRPEVVGDSLFFPFTNESGTGLWEMRQKGRGYETIDVSTQIPGYLPQGPFKIVGSLKHQALFLLDNAVPDHDEARNLYVYKWLDTAQGRTQSAWTRWQFDRQGASGYGANYCIKSMTMGVDRLYLLTCRADVSGNATPVPHYLEYIDLDLTSTDSLLHNSLEDNFNNILLDRKTPHTDCIVEYSGGDSTVTLPWTIPSPMQNDFVLVKAGGLFYTLSGVGASGTLIASDGPSITVEGTDLTGDVFWVGFRYNMSSTFGSFAPKIGDDVIRGRNIFMRGARLTYSNVNRFKIEQTNGTTDYEQVFDAGEVAGTETDAGTLYHESQSGELYFGLRQHMPDLSYTISNDLHWNAYFQGILYDANVQEIKPETTRGMKGARR